MKVYLAKKNGMVIHHTSMDAMKKLDGIEKPDMEITEAEWEAAEGLARVIGGKIFLGKTDVEKSEDQVTEWKNELSQIDREAGVSRAVRGAILETAKKASVTGLDVDALQQFEDRAEPLRKKIRAAKK